MASAILLAASFGVAVQALALDSPTSRPTESALPDPTYEFPSRITVPPSALELAKRQDTQTVLIGPDNICGYVSGRAGAAYSCNALTATCAFVTTSGLGAVACCNEFDCGLRFACLDYDQIMSSSSCDYGCFQDTFTVKCTSTAYPYCGTVSFFDGVVDYYCDSLDGSIVQKAETTFSGQTDDREFTPVAVTLETDTQTANRPSPTSGDDDDDSASASATPGPGPTTSSTPAPSSGGGGSSNTGAIVGGVVGGVAGLALIGVVAWLLIRRNKKNKPVQQPIQQPPQGGYPPMQQAPGPQGPHPGHQSVYNPAYAQPPPQQQQYGVPPNQPVSPQYPPGYYQDQNKPPGFVAMAAVPDRNDSTSPVSQSQDTNNRVSMQPSSPTSTVHSNHPPSQYGQPQPQPPQGQQPQQQGYPSGVPPTVHEASSNVVGQNNWNDNHHGQYHELQ